MKISEVTPLILTFNEEPNLERTLAALSWASKIIVVDSYSTDATVQIATSFPNVTLIQRKFDEHTKQWNAGLDEIKSAWALTLDADYVCPIELCDEIAALPDDDQVYYANFKYCVFGKPLRATLYPARAVLFKAADLRYVRDGHTQLLKVDNHPCATLRTTILHDDRKPLRSWLNAQMNYAELELQKLRDRTQLGWKDRLRTKIFFAPLLVVLYGLLWRGLWLDGWHGFFYCFQRAYAESILSLYLLDQKVRKLSPVAQSVKFGKESR
jgi:glycosyltransferase involved in cell wall biosynthesis